MKILANLSRILLGAYLIFSGFLKVIDPYGTAIKLKEYFEVFAGDVPVLGGFFGLLSSNSVVLSLLFCCLELLIGVALLFSFKPKVTAWVTLLLMSFFTFLTFYSAYFNKVTDCGCFGEFMKLDPWDSFLKNVVAMVFVLIVFFCRKIFKENSAGTPAVLLGSIFSLGIGIYSLSYLPVIDLLPYAVSKSIPEQMKKPDVKLEIEYIFKDNESGDRVKSMEYLMDTTKYTYESSKVLNADAVKAIITDFSLTTVDGEDGLDEAFTGNKLILIIKTIDDLENVDFKKYRDLVSKVSKAGVKPMIFFGVYEVGDFINKNKLNYPYYFSDEKVLKTIARNNPVVLLLGDGVVKGKWSFNKLPDNEKVKGLIK